MILTIGNYRAVPFSSGLCWSLCKKNDAKDGGEESWSVIGRYPATVKGALSQIHEFLAKEKDADCDGWNEVLSKLDEIEGLISDLAERIEDGEEKVETTICPKCESSFPSDPEFKFCPHCGKKLGSGKRG